MSFVIGFFLLITSVHAQVMDLDSANVEIEIIGEGGHTGKCVKVNPMIMGRNWIHLQDGSGDNLDLTITTTENIPVGHVITLEGTIALNKDFGAGYKYDIIMEEAVLQ